MVEKSKEYQINDERNVCAKRAFTDVIQDGNSTAFSLAPFVSSTSAVFCIENAINF